MKRVSVGNTFALVDDRDYALVSRFRWHVTTRGYAQTRVPGDLVPEIGGEGIQMHRLILGLRVGDSRQVDHINHNPLDNRRRNLRVCTPRQNSRNRKPQRNTTSPYKGITQLPTGRWQAAIFYSTKRIALGVYDNPEEAALVYDHAAVKYFGPFAYTNFHYDPNAILPKPRTRSQRSTLGVTKVGKKWEARPRINGKKVYLGRFDSRQKARQAAKEAIAFSEH